jgi:flavin reductase (DIM6/NTAB) family NADH-FMN oxidoreductase RutF
MVALADIVCRDPFDRTIDLRLAFGQFATGVTVVTAQGADGSTVGVTVNSFTSVSLDPPLLLWCLCGRSGSLEAFQSASHFAVNVLSSAQRDLAVQFARPARDRFAGCGVRRGLGGAPILDGVLAHFVCRTTSQLDAGDHVVTLGEVEDFELYGGDPLLFQSGAYRHLSVGATFCP